MKYSTANRGFPAGNPIANVFVMIIGALAIAASIVLGFFAFIIIGSIVLILASVIGIRIWWFKRKPGAQMNSPRPENDGATGGVIEGEYRVVAEDREDE